MNLEFQGIIIKKFERRGTQLLLKDLNDNARVFEARGIIGFDLKIISIRDTLIKVKGNKCIIKRKGVTDTLPYLYLKGYE